MGDIKIEPGTVEVRGLSILSVGEGDTKLTFDPANPQERIRAARIVTDMIRRGYALLVESEPGSRQFVRVKAFDEARCEYIIADLDPLAAQEADDDEVAGAQRGTDEPTNEPATAPGDGASGPAPKLRRGPRAPYKTKRLRAEGTRAVSIGRSAGG